MGNCSVLMVSYHTGPVLFAAIKSVLRQKRLEDLVLVDNGNSPVVLTRLQQMALTEPRLKIITGQGNIGYAKACNLGAKTAAGEFLLMLNPDCLLPPEALAGMMTALESGPDTILAGCCLVNPDGSESVNRDPFTPPQVFSQLPGVRRFLALKYATSPRGSVASACMCIRANDFARLPGFDEAFFLHGEDLDLSLRVQAAGGKVIHLPNIKVTRMRSGASKAFVGSIEWQKAKGVLRYFHKHFRGRYVPGFLLLADAVLIMRFAWKALVRDIQEERRRNLLMTQSVTAKRLMILASGFAELPQGRELHGLTVLVTGATSQIGLCVVRRLLASGAAVLALSRAEAIPFEHEHLRWIKGDLTDNAFSLQGYLADAVVHCAPLWHLPPTIAMLAEAEVKRVIAFGSTSIVAKALSKNDHEKALVEKLIKAEADIAAQCAAKNMNWTLLRPTLIYGVGLDVGVTSLAKFIERAGFFPVYPPAFGRRQPVHADDLALAALQVFANDATYGKAYNLSGGEILTYREMLERLFKLCRKKPRIIETTVLPFLFDVAGFVSRKKHINGEIARRMNDDLVFFHDEAKKDFAFSPRSFLSSGIRDLEGF